MKQVQKVMAYITWRGHVLVFRQPNHPEAGVQVPGGTVAEGETAEDAVRREAFEETGLEGVGEPTWLGASSFNMAPFGKTEMHERSFFRFTLEREPATQWTHEERSGEGLAEPVLFAFWWVEPDTARDLLVAGHGALLDRLHLI